MKMELVFFPGQGMGHIVSAVETAKLLVNQDKQLSITVLIINVPSDTKAISYAKSLPTASNSRIRYVDISQQEAPSLQNGNGIAFLFEFLESHKTRVREILAEISSSESKRLAGIIIGMFCTCMIDVANEFGVPSYVFYASGAAMLGLCFHIQTLKDDRNEDVIQYKNQDINLPVSTYINPVPAKVLPSEVFDEVVYKIFVDLTRRYREAKGIIINTFLELETHAIQALSKDKTIPPVYTAGPLLSSNSSTQNQESERVIKWLDLQPNSSVVFLCFGSKGCFTEAQVRETASALESCGHRFLWSLRRPPADGQTEFPGEYDSPEEVLPEGFLQRTAGVGMVTGWAPQLEVLSHPAVGGFVSHCGWNSTLESVWCGVPIATWPLYAEQQVNAFLMVKDLEMAVEIKMDYRDAFRAGSADILSADLIEYRIRILMEAENGIRKKVKEMKEKSRLALMEEGSSSASIRCFIENVKNNISIE